MNYTLFFLGGSLVAVFAVCGRMGEERRAARNDQKLFRLTLYYC